MGVAPRSRRTAGRLKWWSRAKVRSTMWRARPHPCCQVNPAEDEGRDPGAAQFVAVGGGVVALVAEQGVGSISRAGLGTRRKRPQTGNRARGTSLSLAAVVMTSGGASRPSRIRWCSLPTFRRPTGADAGTVLGIRAGEDLDAGEPTYDRSWASNPSPSPHRGITARPPVPSVPVARRPTDRPSAHDAAWTVMSRFSSTLTTVLAAIGLLRKDGQAGSAGTEQTQRPLHEHQRVRRGGLHARFAHHALDHGDPVDDGKLEAWATMTQGRGTPPAPSSVRRPGRPGASAASRDRLAGCGASAERGGREPPGRPPVEKAVSAVRARAAPVPPAPRGRGPTLARCLSISQGTCAAIYGAEPPMRVRAVNVSCPSALLARAQASTSSTLASRTGSSIGRPSTIELIAAQRGPVVAVLSRHV